MTSDAAQPRAEVCPRCQASLSTAVVRTVMWHDDRPAIVEDIPALVCSGCSEQYYDEAVSMALFRLAEEGFPRETAQRIIEVPVFSLTGRIRQPAPQTSEWAADGP